MTTKLLKGALTRFAVMAIAAVFFTPLASAATSSGDMDNPVTGETKTYDYKYVGSGTWTASDWQDANGAALAAAPGTDNSNLWGSMLVNCSNPISVAQLNGWELQLGVFGGANVTVGELGFWTGSDSCFAAVDNASSLTISATTGKNWNNTVKFYVANSRGITFTSAFAPANPNGSGNIHYYLKKSGSVTYSSALDGGVGHVIKQADVSLTGTSQVSSKTLVSFASTTKTFTADAAIKVYGTDGTTLEGTVNLVTVNTTGATTLTPTDPVGSCELVQTATGIDLYYVDGTSFVAKTYKPSISVNFTSGTSLSTLGDVGVGDCAIPGTSWNNVIGNAGTLSSVTQIDANGVATTVDGVSVTISGTRGYWTCGSVNAATDLRQGYVDDAAGANASPQVAISGIPYYSYYAVVYFSNNDAGVKFGYVTINGTNYKWDNDTSALVECTGAASDMWGASSPTAWTEGGNYIVTPTFVNSDGSFTIVGHRLTSDGVTARSGIAAIQIVEVPKVAEEGELVINVSGDTTYTVDANATYTTVYATGTGTLSFSGSGVITTTTFNIGNGVTMPMDTTHLSPATVTGSGTIVYDGAKPTQGLGWTDSANWKGVVWVKNISSSSNESKDWDLALYGNANSTLRLTGVNLYFKGSTDNVFPGTVDLDGTGMNVCNGYGGSITTIARLTGSGTLSTGGGSSNGNGLTINDASAFTGVITLTKFKVIIGTSTGTSASGVLQIDAGAVATVASGTTWTAPGGFVVNGTLNDNGTLTSSASAAVTGSGTVVFTGRAPTPTGEAWWINGGWQGAVAINNVANLVGHATGFTGTYLDFNSYGNAGSVIKLGATTGWLGGNYICTVPVNLAGTLTINNGISGEAFTFKKLSSNGGYITATDQSATSRIVIEDGSEYAGYIGLNSKMVVFGTANPDFVKGRIYISHDATITVPAVNTAFWAVGSIVVDGELKADGLARFGGGTSITTTDNGVFTLTSTGNGTETETNIDYARIKGTGTLKYDGTGWRALSTNNFPTAVTLVNEQAGDILLSRALTYSVGSLSGTKNLQGNYGSGARYLRVIQSQDTEWGGIVVSDGQDRFKGLTVAPGATAGTLTLSGTQVKAQTLTVESGAKVNLTGTWVGATTVAGTFGGTGTLTGNLTLTDGATIKVNDISNPLEVSGSLTATGAITIELPEGAGKGMIFTTGSKPDISGATFTTKIGGVEKKLKVTAAADGLKVGVQSLLIRIR